MQDRPRDAQLGGSASDAEMGRTIKISTGDGEGFLSETSPIGPGSRQPRPNSLGDPCSLELGDRGEHMELQPPGRCRAVDPLAQ